MNEIYRTYSEKKLAIETEGNIHKPMQELLRMNSARAYVYCDTTGSPAAVDLHNAVSLSEKLQVRNAVLHNINRIKR